MDNNEQTTQPMTVHQFTDAMIRVALITLLVIASLRVFNPFMDMMLWALILAVTIYPSHQKLAAKLGGNQGRSATAIVLLGIIILGVPIAIIGSSLADQLSSVHEQYTAGTLSVRPPPEKVAEWPLIGEQTYKTWSAASTNFTAFIEDNQRMLEGAAAKSLAAAKSTAANIFMFIGALIIAGIMMAYGQSGGQAMYYILCRIVGEEQGAKIHVLVTMTTRSVAAGVLGVALIQAVLLGIGFVLIGVPAAGVLAFIVLLLAIMQLPATIISVPVIIWLWNSGDAGTIMNVVWLVYLIVAGLSDNILKPILLGRGVDAPMPVILIGALGGMVASGFIGLFTGAVVLAVAYEIFMRWVDAERGEEEAEAAGAGE